MGRIIKQPNAVVVRLGIEEALSYRLAASKNVVVTLAQYLSKMAELKAEQKGVKVPSQYGSITFDKSTGEVVVKFTTEIEQLIA